MIRNKRGELMIEAIIIYPITVSLLFLILALFSVYYQRWNLQIIADSVAVNVAQTYRYTNVVDDNSMLTQDNLVSIKPGRYNLFNNSLMKTNAATRVNNLALSWLSTTSFDNGEDMVIDVKVVSDSLARRHIEVDISGNYKVPFGGVFEFFEMNNIFNYHAVGYCDCYDPISLINTVDLLDNTVHSGLLDFFDDAVDLGSDIYKLFDGE